MKRKILAAVVFLILFFMLEVILVGGKVSVHTDKEVKGLDDELKEVFYLASLAPSSHNTQGWLVSVYPEEGRAVAAADAARGLSVVDPAHREAFISLGCYAETLRSAFTAYGYETALAYDEEKHECVLSYRKTGADIQKDATRLIQKRHTEKRAFSTEKKVEPSVVSEMLAGLSHVEFHLAGSREFDAIKTATLEAYEKQAYDLEAASELSDWLRLSNREAKARKDGLPAEQLGLSGIRKFFYYLITNHENAKGKTFADQGVATCRKQLENCTGFAVVCGDNTEARLVECGRNTVRLWLALTDKNISAHPLSYALEDSAYKTMLTDALQPESEPQMILRIGYVENYGENAGIRRDLADYISVH